MRICYIGQGLSLKSGSRLNNSRSSPRSRRSTAWALRGGRIVRRGRFLLRSLTLASQHNRLACIPYRLPGLAYIEQVAPGVLYRDNTKSPNLTHFQLIVILASLVGKSSSISYLTSSTVRLNDCPSPLASIV